MRRIITLLLAVLMIFGLAVPAVAVETAPDISLQSSLPFTDVRSNQWFYPYVRTMYQSGVMTGTSATTFDPQGTFTRAQVLATLFRIHTGRTSNASDSRDNNFTDVASGQWFAPYVTWAANNGITEATSGNFAPNRAAERQEIAFFIYRYIMNLTTLDGTSTATAQWNAFTDREQISGGSNYIALRWANNHGIINGRTSTIIAPTGTAIRAEAAAMLVRLMGLLPETGTPQPPIQQGVNIAPLLGREISEVKHYFGDDGGMGPGGQWGFPSTGIFVSAYGGPIMGINIPFVHPNTLPDASNVNPTAFRWNNIDGTTTLAEAIAQIGMYDSYQRWWPHHATGSGTTYEFRINGNVLALGLHDNGYMEFMIWRVCFG